MPKLTKKNKILPLFSLLPFLWYGAREFEGLHVLKYEGQHVLKHEGQHVLKYEGQHEAHEGQQVPAHEGRRVNDGKNASEGGGHSTDNG